jgi:hypothetical protein
MSQIESQTDVYRKLFAERFKPETDKEIVYCSIILQLSEALERQTKQIGETTKAVKYLARVVGAGMQRAASVEVEQEAEPAAQTTSAPEQQEPERQQDNTPFPAGFSAGGAVPTAPSAPAAATATATPVEEGIPTPDAGSGPAMNAQPIVQKAQRVQSKNGAKAEA